MQQLKEAKERLQARLTLYQMKERPVPGDGNCQMPSLSDQLFQSFMYAGAIRANIVAWLRRNGELELVRILFCSVFVALSS